MAEYFGGIWAASLSPDGQNDRGLVWADLVARLAASDLHLHYLIYDAFRRIFVGRDLQLGHSSVSNQCALYLPMTKDRVVIPVSPRGQHTPMKVVIEVKGETAEVSGPIADIAATALSLKRHDLIGEAWASGSREHLSSSYQVDAPRTGLVVRPSLSGIELFLWAHGVADTFQAILDAEVHLETVEEIARIQGSRELAEMQKERQEREQAELQRVGSLQDLADHVERNG
jgi:hypothetical protein